MPVSQSNNLPDRSPPSRHEQILIEAARQLNSKGVSHTSLTAIAEAVGISRATLYYYVKDRRDLVYQSYRRASEVMLEKLEQVRQADGAIGVLTRYISSVLGEGEPPIAAHSDVALLEPAQREELSGLNATLYEQLAGVLRQGEEQGQLRHCDHRINARSIVSLLCWAPLAKGWLLTSSPLTQDRIINTIITIVLNGYASSKTLPEFQTIDLSDLAQASVVAFDRQAIAQAKREAVLTRASRLFNYKGVDATSLDEIAAELGSSKRSIHRLIGSKDDVVMACCTRGFRIFNHIRDAMMNYPGSRLEALTAAHHALAVAYPREDLCPMSLFVGLDSLPQARQDELEKMMYNLGAGYYVATTTGMKEGSIGEIDMEIHVSMLPGLLSWLLRSEVPKDTITRDKMADEVAALIAVGLAR